MNYTTEQLRAYASLFSSQTGMRTLRFGDIDDIQYVYDKYDAVHYHDRDLSCWDYLSKVYDVLRRHYRNEYVYKNELINDFLKDRYLQKDTVILNEFGAGTSIADIATFNGNSKAFEIKSERDSDKRLLHQLDDYSKLFDECYVVVPEEQSRKYESLLDVHVGMLLLSHGERGSISVHVYRPALLNPHIDIDILMQSVRMSEYQWMVRQVMGRLPDVSCFEMFNACKSVLMDVPEGELHVMFNEVVKLRKSKMSDLKEKSRSVRQLFLSMNLNRKQERELDLLYQTIL